MEIIQEFWGSFSELTKQDWSEILILLGVASLLSFIIGWILRSFKVRSLRNLLAEKDAEYKRLNTNYKNNLNLLSSREEEEAIFNNKIRSLSDEVESLKLKLANNKNDGAVMAEESAEALVLTEGEVDGEAITNKRWIDKIRDVFSTKQPIGEEVGLAEVQSISIEEKLKATNNLVDRLLSSNEKLEDENLSLKNKVIELENKPVEVKTVVEKPAETIVVNKSEAEKYTQSLTEARITGQDLLKRIQELEVYNGKIIKQLEEANTRRSTLQTKLKSNGDFKVQYTDLAAKFEQVEIKNNKLSAEIQSLVSTAKKDTFEAELKNKTALLADCTKEKTILEDKLNTLAKQIENRNEKATQQLKEAQAKEAAEKEKLAAERKAAEAKKIGEEKAKQEAEAKRLAEEKAQQEAKKAAEAKKITEEKAKQETEAKRLAEEKAKQTAQAKAAQELRAKQEAELKKAAELKAKQAADIQKQKSTPVDSSHDIMERIKSKAANINFTKIGKGDPTKKDDLKQIKGIGEFVEKKLNALGIYNFGQVANLSGDDIDKVNDAIEFFPGRIKRDNWVGQAKNLAKK